MRRHTITRSAPRVSLVLAVLAASVAPAVLIASPASAEVITSVVLSGAGTSTNNATSPITFYGQPGASITITVTADAQTKCVQLTGTFAAQISSSSSPFVFNLTAPSGASSTLTVKATNGNNKDGCNGNADTETRRWAPDSTPPVVTGVVTPAPNAAGWNKANASIAWTATDTSGSGIASHSPTSDTVTTETASVTKTSTATDNVGNSATGSVVVKLDKTAPTITGSRSPAANANGWNNTDVTASFSCGDALSGIKTCPAPTTFTASGANHGVVGTATDNADNSAVAGVTGINIDKVAPTLSGAPTTSPNAAGWYKNNVTVAWTAADALSGVISQPANSTIGSEGTGLTASTSTTDRAGNTTSATSAPAVKIDKTAPTTSATAPPEWNNNSVAITLTGNDPLSGVATTQFIADGGGVQTGNNVTFSTEGTHTLEYWSTDVAGNVEAHQSITVKIDKTSPTISHTQAPAANTDGWNNGDVTVTFLCSDEFSGIASCTPPQVLTAEGFSVETTGTAVDNAGNTASDPVAVKIDKTKPVISAAPDRAANGAGWYQDDVIVTFTCSDALSGLGAGACPDAQTLGEGAGQSASGSVTDVAGNSSSASVEPINVDKTAPLLSGAPTTASNANGWYRSNVMVDWTCSDALSGLAAACPADEVLTGEGADVCATKTVSDVAGNLTTASVCVKIDRTTPSTIASGQPAGWTNNNVTVSLAATDGLSQVAATYYSLDGAAPVSGDSVAISATGTHTVEYWSVDNAGNEETHQALTVQIDKVLPGISHTKTPGPNVDGWNNTDVAVDFTCTDTPSGIASCDGDQTVIAEGAGQQVQGTATDNAGNQQTDTATVSIDKTAPVISAAADRAANASGWYKDDVVVTFTCNDALSGVVDCPDSITRAEGADQSASGTVLDQAGNSSSASVTGLNVDKTPPTLGGAPLTAANAAGWYKGDVVIEWACYDALSGIVGCPGNSTITGEGAALTASASVSDVAENETSATTAPIKIDRHAPMTTADAPTSWVNQDAHVTLVASDGLSGVASTHYTVNYGPVQSGTTVDLAEGQWVLEFWSVDAAGNEEGRHTVEVKVDKTAPSIDDVHDPVANSHGWNNTSVTITFTCSDALSGIFTCTSPVTVSAEGQGQQVTGTAVDNATNSASRTTTVSIDKTAPTIVGEPDRPANDDDWYDDDVTVSFDCADALSGIKSCLGDTTMTEGAGQSVTGTATDSAGNVTTAEVGPISVDKTDPTITGAATTAPNADGWYRGDVVVHWTCADALSGVKTCPADETLTGEGSDLSASGTAYDLAGNQQTATVTGIKIDRVAPVTTANAPDGWTNHAVTLTLSPTDGLSDVKSTHYTLDGGPTQTGTSVSVTADGTHQVEFWSVDKAGNVEEHRTVIVKVDTTLPSIDFSQAPAKNANGWNKTDVTVTFTCDDATSGVASCTAPQLVDAEGPDQPVTGTVVDNASNSATATALVSVDKTAPTISAAADRGPNANNWYDANVVIAFTCNDTLSGIDSCTAPKTLAEGANQSASGTAVDAAGNSASAGVTGINVDKTAPLLSGAPTTIPNDAGWYKAPVAIGWTCSDALSGVDGNCPVDSTIGGEGVGMTATESVSDKAGHTTTAESAPAVKIDQTDPITQATAPTSWTNADAPVSLAATDNLSGVAVTRYSLDGGPTQTGTSLTVESEGTHSLVFWSVDAAGNEEAHQAITILVDKSAPTIINTHNPVANAAGWNNTDVLITFICADQAELSGIASCTAPVTVTTEGASQLRTGVAEDNAGNTATDSTSVSIDKTKPTIAGAPDRAANAAGWYDADVTVVFTCDDALSGTATCSSDTTLGQGAGQSVTGHATDLAGNSESDTVSGINVDKTNPTIHGAPTTAANADGWYNSNVQVDWTCGDALSGIASCSTPSAVAGEGSALSASGTAVDKAGNTEHATVSPIRIDRTDPNTTSDAPSGWQNSDVTLTLSASDALSGVKVTRYTVDGGATQSGTSVAVAGNGDHTVTFWSADKAGNTEVVKTVHVLIDKTAPTITGAATTSANAAGWYRGSVTVHFTCADQAGLSGLASCPDDVTLSNNGANQSATGTATDNAGNTKSVTVSGIHIDLDAPTVAVTGVADGGVYVLGAVPTAGCTASDGLSGLAGPCTGSTTGGTPNGVGTYVYTATATDKAGNTGTRSATYRVVYNVPAGQAFFLQPINDTAHQVGVNTSVFKAGSTVPVKFHLRRADGTIVSPNSAPIWLAPARGGSTSVAVNEGAYSAPADSGSTFRASGDLWIYNWQTPRDAGYYYRIGVRLDDGQTYYVNIGLR